VQGTQVNPRRSKNGTITLRDVARESGFSPATVSIVLNEAPLARYIPAHTKERIAKAARRLGYRPNQLARSLRSSRNHTLGVMVFDITDPYCTPIVRGIENTLYQASFVPILADAHNDRGRFERYLEMLLERRVEGLVVVANWMLVDIRQTGNDYRVRIMDPAGRMEVRTLAGDRNKFKDEPAKAGAGAAVGVVGLRNPN